MTSQEATAITQERQDLKVKMENYFLGKQTELIGLVLGPTGVRIGEQTEGKK